MITASVADLKARLASYLKQLKAGHEILITQRGLPVGKIVPIDGKKLRGTRRGRLAKEGFLRPGRGRVRKSLLSPPKGKWTGKTVLEALLEERDEER